MRQISQTQELCLFLFKEKCATILEVYIFNNMAVIEIIIMTQKLNYSALKQILRLLVI
jgi:hypothetical protein